MKKVKCARKLGMGTVGFLMTAHMNSPEGLVKQVVLMEGYDRIDRDALPLARARGLQPALAA
jgi:hypothetical protein